MDAALSVPSPAHPAAVRIDRLLWPYLVVPLSLAFVAFDRLVMHGKIAPLLPRHPDQLLFFTLVFTLPHIFVSHLLFFDREYIASYGRRLVVVMLALIALTATLLVVSPIAIGALGLLWTCYHITAQQVGLVGMQLRTPAWDFKLWRGLSLFLGCGGLVCGAEVMGSSPLRGLFLLLSLLVAGPWMWLAVRLSRRAPPTARRYLWANQLLFASVVATWAGGYPMIGALMPRVVHDMTAFYVYSVHDTNRNAVQPRNLFHKLLAPLHLPAWLIAPVIALGLTFWLQSRGSQFLVMQVSYWLSAVHYYFEGFVWKGPTLHRRHAPFA